MKAPPDEDSTGLPWPRSWAGVYGLVLAVFGAWILLLTVLSRLFP